MSCFEQKMCFECPNRKHSLLRDVIAAMALKDNGTVPGCDGPTTEAVHINVWHDRNRPDVSATEIQGCGKDPQPQDGPKVLYFRAGILERIAWPEAQNSFYIVKDKDSAEYNDIKPLWDIENL